MFTFSHQVGAQSSSARTEPSDTGNKAMPSGRVFSSRLVTTGVAEFRLEIRQGFGLVSSGRRPIWTSPNLRSRVSELHPDMPRVSTRKSRDCFLVWDLSHKADLTQVRRAMRHSQTIRRAKMAARQNPVFASNG